jgi:hypothetical protein
VSVVAGFSLPADDSLGGGQRGERAALVTVWQSMLRRSIHTYSRVIDKTRANCRARSRSSPPQASESCACIFCNPSTAKSAVLKLPKEDALTVEAPELLKKLPDLTGIPRARVQGVYRNQREANLIPSCIGATMAELGGTHATYLLFGSLADVPVHKATEAAKLYSGLKDSAGVTAGEELERMFASFRPSNGDIEYAALTYRTHVIIDLDVPRVTIVRESDDDEQPNIRVFGVKRSKSTETLIQHSKTISGKVLFEMAAILHSDYWATKQRNAN